MLEIITLHVEVTLISKLLNNFESLSELWAPGFIQPKVFYNIMALLKLNQF